MGNFGRILRLTLRYRFTLAASVVCAWPPPSFGAETSGRSIPFCKSPSKAARSRNGSPTEISGRRRRPIRRAGPATRRGRSQAPGAAIRLGREVFFPAHGSRPNKKAAARYRRYQPYMDRYLPTTRSPPWWPWCWRSSGGHGGQDLFLISDSILVSRLGELTTFDLRKRFYRRPLRMDVATVHQRGAQRADDPLH